MSRIELQAIIRALSGKKCLNPEPDYTLTTELKNPQDGNKVDGAVLAPKTQHPLAVIELKGNHITDLTRVDNQAFGCHSSHPTNRYIVISNFEKLRFYIDKRNAYEEFNLFRLTRERFPDTSTVLGNLRGTRVHRWYMSSLRDVVCLPTGDPLVFFSPLCGWKPPAGSSTTAGVTTPP